MKTFILQIFCAALIIFPSFSIAQDKKKVNPAINLDSGVHFTKALCKFSARIETNCGVADYYTLTFSVDSGQNCESKGRLALYYSISDTAAPKNPMRFLDTNEHILNDHFNVTKPGFYAIRLWSTNDSSIRLGDFSEWAPANYCPMFEMPSDFSFQTSNAGVFLGPKKSRHIAKIDLVIFDPLGNEVFLSNDAEFRWNMRRQDNGQPIESGVYYYSCTVHEKNLKSPRTRKISGSINIRSDQ